MDHERSLLIPGGSLKIDDDHLPAPRNALERHVAGWDDLQAGGKGEGYEDVGFCVLKEKIKP